MLPTGPSCASASGCEIALLAKAGTIGRTGQTARIEPTGQNATSGPTERTDRIEPTGPSALTDPSEPTDPSALIARSERSARNVPTDPSARSEQNEVAATTNHAVVPQLGSASAPDAGVELSRRLG